MGGQDTVALTVTVSVIAGLVALLALAVVGGLVQDGRQAREVAQRDAVLDDCRAFVADELAAAGTATPDRDAVRDRAVERFGVTAAVESVVDSVLATDGTDDLVRGVPPAAHQACARLSVDTT